MNHGQKSGIIMLAAGAAAVGITQLMILGGMYMPKLIVLGTTVGGYGLGHLLFRGAEPPPEMPYNEKVNYHMKNAPAFSQFMWFILLAGGAGAGIYWVSRLGGF
jgi:hypothetical protein